MSDNYDPTASYALLLNELEGRGFRIRHYSVDDQHYVEYTHPSGKVWLTRTKHFSYPLNHGAIMEMADNKTLAYKWVAQFDAAVADFITLGPADTLSGEAMDELLSKHEAWVVKPESGYASHGLTLNINSRESMQKAIEVARSTEQFSSNIIVQQQVAGEELRFAVLDGSVISVLQRQPLRVIGDGQHSLSELINEENATRASINRTSLVHYPVVESVMNDPSLDIESIPSPNEMVELASSTMISGGASVFNVIDQVHPSYIEFVETIIAKLGARFLVVDLFTPDFNQPMNVESTYFNEFNKAPALKMFYSCRNEQQFDIVPVLADAIEKSMRAQ